MSGALSFVRWPGVAQSFYLLVDPQQGTAEAQAASARMGYLLTSENPDSFTLVESWSKYPGCYVFFAPFEASNSAVPQFVAAAADYLGVPGRERVRFAWFDRAAEPSAGLFARMMHLDSNPASDPSATSAATRFDFRNWSLLIGASSQIALDADANRFVITNGTPFAPETPSIYLLISGQRDSQLGVPSAPPATPLHVVGPSLVIPLTGESQGTFEFAMAADQATFDDLDVGLRYFMPGAQSLLFTIPANSPSFPSVYHELTSQSPDDTKDPWGALKAAFADASIQLNNPCEYSEQLGYRWWIEDVPGDATQTVFRYLLVNARNGLNIYAIPSASTFLFQIETGVDVMVAALKTGTVDATLRAAFAHETATPLSSTVTVSASESPGEWMITDDESGQRFTLTQHQSVLLVSVKTREFPGQLNSQRYRVFNLSGALTLSATLDPLHDAHDAQGRAAASRTHLTFDPATLLGTFFRTKLGHPVDLQPAAPAAGVEPARLVLANRPSAITRGAESESAATWVPDNRDYYWVPAGDFAVSFPDSSAAEVRSLMCGVSGIETIDMQAGQVVRFEPNNAAFAPSFLRGKPSEPDAVPEKRTDDLLDPAGTTAWLSVHTALTDTAAASSDAVSSDTAPVVPSYWSQPANSPLYQLSASALKEADVNASPDVLSFLPVKVTDLPKEAATPFPLTPLAGVVSDDLLNYRQFELEIVATQRRTTMFTMAKQVATSVALANAAPSVPAARGVAEPAAASAAVAPPVTGTTPQGLLSHFDADMQWSTIRFAQSSLNVLQFVNVSQPLPQQDPPSRLKLAFQSSHLFFVVSDPAAIAPYFATDNVMEIEGWEFVLNPAPQAVPGSKVVPNPVTWQTHNTVLIFKFYDKSLEELVADTRAWTESATFVGADPATIQAAILQNIQDARDAQQKGDHNFDHFLNTIVANPNWNGVIALNVPVPLTGLPPDIAGLAAGIEQAGFYAHHMGINVSPAKKKQVSADPPTYELVMGPSSLFGLINYVDDTPFAQTASDYGFKVETLRVLFANSSISNFSSKVALKIDALFGEPVTLVGSEANVITLNGTYQKHDGHSTYVFSEDKTNSFVTAGKTLKAVHVLKVQFTTSPPQDDEAPSIETRFSIWGKLEFFKLPAFDAFSFGAPEKKPAGDTKVYGLSFSNLGINMVFPAENPHDSTFTFDPSQLAFDLSVGTTTARENSFYNHFPMKLTGLIASAANQTPGGLGYATVETPLPSSQLGQTWYGLEYELKLGTLGDLAGKVGMTANVLTAWTPGTSSEVLIGLRLPFAHGGKIGIEGVVALAVNTFQIRTYQGAGATAEDPQTGYLLKFNKVTLSLMKQTMPPGGTISMTLFGDSEGTTKNDTLGWYGAYAKKPPPPKKKDFGPPINGA